jgi:hypothetical protein
MLTSSGGSENRASVPVAFFRPQAVALNVRALKAKSNSGTGVVRELRNIESAIFRILYRKFF